MKPSTVRRTLLLAGGATVLTLLVQRAGTASIRQYLTNLGLAFTVPIALVGLQHCLRSLSWHAAVRATGHPLPYSHILRARLGAETLGYLSLTGALGSQTSKVWLLREGVPMSTGAASVIVDALASGIAGVLFSGAALLVSQWALALPAWTAAVGGGLVALAAASWTLATLWSGQRRRLDPDGVLTAPPATDWRAAARDALRRMGAGLVRLRGLPFARMILLHTLGHLALVAATRSILSMLGISRALSVGIVFEVGAKLGNVMGVLIPARLGLFEAGVAASADLLRLGSAAGLAVAFVRRIVDLAWVGAGLVILTTGPLRQPSVANEE
ncbi:MAG: lysylphosphatidylglycerol synthase domain-containing protein [Acidobacteriota bacterium]